MADSNASKSRPTRREAEDVPTTSATGSSSPTSSTSATSSTGSAATAKSPRFQKGPKAAKPAKGAQPSPASQAAPAASASDTDSSEGSSASSGPSFVDKVKIALRDASRNLDDARTAPGTGAAPSRATTNKRPTRRARLRLTRLDPWSVAKMAFLLSIALGVVLVVAVALVWGVLDAAGVWDSINSMVYQVIGQDSGTDFDVENYLGTSRIVGFTLIVAGIDVLLLTAIATLAAFLYNLGAALLGGVEVTLAEDAR